MLDFKYRIIQPIERGDLDQLAQSLYKNKEKNTRMGHGPFGTCTHDRDVVKSFF